MRTVSSLFMGFLCDALDLLYTVAPRFLKASPLGAPHLRPPYHDITLHFMSFSPAVHELDLLGVLVADDGVCHYIYNAIIHRSSLSALALEIVSRNKRIVYTQIW